MRNHLLFSLVGLWGLAATARRTGPDPLLQKLHPGFDSRSVRYEAVEESTVYQRSSTRQPLFE